MGKSRFLLATNIVFENYDQFTGNYEHIFYSKLQTFCIKLQNYDQFIRNYKKIVKETKIWGIIFCFEPNVGKFK